jgi:uroporphyrinogen decarboxylase
MARTRSLLPADKSLIGFVGGPWTLFTYAVEGSHSGALGKAKCQMDLFEDFCDIIVPFLIDNISLQLDAGAEIVMIFDTAAGELPARDFESYVVPQVEKLAKAHPSRLGYYSKGTLSRHLRRLWGHLHWAGFGYDHRFDLSEVFGKQMTGFVQGNFDQALLFAEEASFEDMVLEYLEPFLRLSEAQRAGWVCGLGHGVLPGTPEGNVRSFVQIIRQSL